MATNKAAAANAEMEPEVRGLNWRIKSFAAAIHHQAIAVRAAHASNATKAKAKKVKKVRGEGTPEMQRQYEALLASLDAPPEPADDGFRVGLPRDIYTDVVHQPMQEIEVYRGLDDLVLPEGAPAGADEDEAAEEADDDAANP